MGAKREVFERTDKEKDRTDLRIDKEDTKSRWRDVYSSRKVEASGNQYRGKKKQR